MLATGATLPVLQQSPTRLHCRFWNSWLPGHPALQLSRRSASCKCCAKQGCSRRQGRNPSHMLLCQVTVVEGGLLDIGQASFAVPCCRCHSISPPHLVQRPDGARWAHLTRPCYPVVLLSKLYAGWSLSGCAGVDEARVLSLAHAAGFLQAEAHVHHLAGNYSAALDCMSRIKTAPGDGLASIDAWCRVL